MLISCYDANKELITQTNAIPILVQILQDNSTVENPSEDLLKMIRNCSGALLLLASHKGAVLKMKEKLLHVVLMEVKENTAIRKHEQTYTIVSKLSYKIKGS